ncbi:unnamed protein product [Toxocara canis]|uniref:Transmembrane protein n=1 Tax=Toxocara canis TaxID=6265 RepID=A0A183URH5_TOXCA|nr:unnamed protein product [Toxocara canis]
MLANVLALQSPLANATASPPGCPACSLTASNDGLSQAFTRLHRFTVGAARKAMKSDRSLRESGVHTDNRIGSTIRCLTFSDCFSEHSEKYFLHDGFDEVRMLFLGLFDYCFVYGMVVLIAVLATRHQIMPETLSLRHIWGTRR